MLREIGSITASNVIQAIAQWAVVVIVARVLGAEAQGNYSFAVAVVTPFAIFARLNLRAMLATDHLSLFRFADYIQARFVWGLFGWFSPPLILALTEEAAVAYLALAIGALKYIEGLVEVAHGQLQKERKAHLILLGTSLRSFLALFVFAALIFGRQSAVDAALGTALIWLLTALVFEFRNIAAPWIEGGHVFRGQVWALSRQSVAMGISMALLSLFAYTPLYFLKFHSDASEVGRYAAVSYIWLIGVFFATSVIQSVAPRLAAAYHEAPRRYVYLLAKTMLVTSACGVALIAMTRAWGDKLIVTMYGPEYSGMRAVSELMVIALLLSVGQSLMGLNQTIARAFGDMLRINVVAAIAIVVLSAWLIPLHGAYGAAVAFVSAIAAKFIMSAVQVAVQLKKVLKSYAA